MGQHRGRRKPKQLAAKLLAIRFKLEVSQGQLARLLGFDKGSARISEFERGIREPDLMTLLKFSELARVSLEILADDRLELKFPKGWKKPRSVSRLRTHNSHGNTEARTA